MSGTPPESILACEHVTVVENIADERIFYRPADVFGREVQEPGRLIEAYHWGRMTSGRWWQALWAPLAPFAIANTALWMLPRPEGEYSRTPGADDAPRYPLWWIVARACVRVIGLLLTVIFMMQTALVVVDLIAGQCLGATDGQCLKGYAPADWFRGRSVRLALLIGVPLAVVLGVGAFITRLTVQDSDGVLPVSTDVPGAATPIPPAGEPGLQSDDFYDGAPSAGPLRTLHGVAAAAATALVVSAGWRSAATGFDQAVLMVAAAILVVVLVHAVLLDRGIGAGAPERYRYLRGKAGLVCVLGAAAVFVVSCVAVALRPAGAGGAAVSADDTMGVPIAITIGVADLAWVLMAVVLLRPLRTARAVWNGYPAAYRPWLGGRSSLLFAGLAILLGPALGVGVAKAVANFITGRLNPFSADDADDLSMPEFYDHIAMQWGIVIVALIVAGATLGVMFFFIVRFSPAPVPERLSGVSSQDGVMPRVRRKRRWTWFVATLNQRVHVFVAGVLTVAVLAGIVAAVHWVARFRYGYHGADAVVRPLVFVGIGGLAFMVFGLNWIILDAGRKPGSVGRSLGVLWDMSSFWPREGHPIVPACYAPKAVQDIVERVEGYLEDDEMRPIVLSGHSQGSLLMYAAAMRLMKNRPDDVSRIGLLTYGSQLQWAYGRAFPAYLGFASHRMVMTRLEGRWISLIRFTDPVGGPVLSWNLGADPLSRDEAKAAALVWGGASKPSVEAPAPDGSAFVDDDVTFALSPGRTRVGNEYWLPDPPYAEPYDPDRPRGHSNYPREADWNGLVDSVMSGASWGERAGAGSEPAPAPAPLRARDRSARP